MLDEYVRSRIIFIDTILDCLRNTTGNRVATSGSCCIVDWLFAFVSLHIDAFRFENTCKFFKSNNEIYVASHRITGSFQFFRRTWTDKYHT